MVFAAPSSFQESGTENPCRHDPLLARFPGQTIEQPPNHPLRSTCSPLPPTRRSQVVCSPAFLFSLYPIWTDASLPFFLPRVNKLPSKQIIRTQILRILTRSVNKVSTNFPSLPSNSPKVSKSSSCFFEISSTSKS